jgi:FkbM family methyltransferase
MFKDHLMQIVKLSGHTFVPTTLHRDSVVVDLGANTGGFSRAITERYGCTCFSVEASPVLFGALRTGTSQRAYNYAMCDRDEPLRFHLSSNNEASSTFAQTPGATGQVVTVPGRSLQTLLRELDLARVHLLKIDIEGSEVLMLLNTPDAVLRQIDQITVEFHNLVGLCTVEEIMKVVRKLQNAGFDAVRFDGLHAGSIHPDHLDHLNWLFMRRSAPGMNPLRRWYVRKPMRFVRWAIQRIRRSRGRPDFPGGRAGATSLY